MILTSLSASISHCRSITLSHHLKTTSSFNHSQPASPDNVRRLSARTPPSRYLRIHRLPKPRSVGCGHERVVLVIMSHNPSPQNSIKALRLHPAINLAISRFRLLQPTQTPSITTSTRAPALHPCKPLTQHLSITNLSLDHSQPASHDLETVFETLSASIS